MNDILEFAKNASPIMLLALCLIIIIILLFNNSKFTLLNVFKVKDLNEEEKIEKPSLDTISKQLEIIAGNHLHELPEMKRTLDKIAEEQITQGNRLTSVETTIKILLKP